MVKLFELAQRLLQLHVALRRARSRLQEFGARGRLLSCKQTLRCPQACFDHSALGIERNQVCVKPRLARSGGLLGRHGVRCNIKLSLGCCRCCICGLQRSLLSVFRRGRGSRRSMLTEIGLVL
mmetsp:Transcript_24956/g.79131  ORF Transcript_24956/g.79131 Transcript_24956/m.79131 type:complete len:123 (-) Transcript_24956:109-477(-)